MMKLDFQRKKTIIVAGLVLLIGADAAMAIYSVGMASSGRSPQQVLAGHVAQLKLLQADVERARTIKKDTPSAKRDCDEFESSLPHAGTGYSVVSSELAEIGHKAGLQISSLSFHQRDLEAHGIAEVAVDATVAGDYKSVVRFLNGLQRSENYYSVDNLALTGESAGGAPSGTLKVDVHMKAYLKAGA
jgi:Tfp pilus assembly protein PilO